MRRWHQKDETGSQRDKDKDLPQAAISFFLFLANLLLYLFLIPNKF